MRWGYLRANHHFRQFSVGDSGFGDARAPCDLRCRQMLKNNGVIARDEIT
jgi:hypothetical protein